MSFHSSNWITLPSVIPNTTASEPIKITLKVARKDGKFGSTTFSLEGKPDVATTTGATKVTFKLTTPDGYFGNQTFGLNVRYSADSYQSTTVIPVARKDDTGEKATVTVKMRRANGDYGQAVFEMPMSKVSVSGRKATYIEFKLRTEDGLYAERFFDLMVK